LAEKRNEVPLVPERDIDMILDDIENEEEKRKKSQDQDGQPGKDPGICFSVATSEPLT